MRPTAVVLVVLLGSAVGGVQWWGHQEPAAAATHDRAVLLFNAMETYAGATALDQAREARRRGGVRIMVARETEDGREIVLAVTAVSTRRNNFDWWPAQDAQHRATRCYRWTPERVWDTAEQVDCPGTRSIDRARAPEAGPVGPEVERLVRQALDRHRDVPGVHAALRDVPGVDVQRVDGTVAVAVLGDRGYRDGRRVNDCLLAFRRGPVVQVWKPSSVQVSPGEQSCTAATALSSEAQAPPH